MYLSCSVLRTSKRIASKILSTRPHTILTTQYRTKTIKKKTVTLIPGDGIGPEICGAVVDIFKAAKIPIEWEIYNIKGEEQYYSKELHDSIKRNRTVMKGPLLTPIGEGYESIDTRLAEQYDLFVHVVPIKSPPLAEENKKLIACNNIDMTVIRENTEAEYSGLEHEVVPGVIESLKIVTEMKSMRVARYAFETASKNWGCPVICVHKANIMKMSDGLFLKCCRKVAQEYPDVPFEELIIDNCAMQLVNYPHKFYRSVIVTTNLYGAIISNIASGLIGGPGLIGGYNIGESNDRITVFEQGARHVASDIAGKGIANPVGMIRSGYYLLAHLGMHEHNLQIRRALKKTLGQRGIDHLTPDLGGKASTKQFVDAVISNLEEPRPLKID